MHFLHYEKQQDYVLVNHYQRTRFHLYNVFKVPSIQLPQLFHYRVKINCNLKKKVNKIKKKK